MVWVFFCNVLSYPQQKFSIKLSNGIQWNVFIIHTYMCVCLYGKCYNIIAKRRSTRLYITETTIYRTKNTKKLLETTIWNENGEKTEKRTTSNKFISNKTKHITNKTVKNYYYFYYIVNILFSFQFYPFSHHYLCCFSKSSSIFN